MVKTMRRLLVIALVMLASLAVPAVSALPSISLLPSVTMHVTGSTTSTDGDNYTWVGSGTVKGKITGTITWIEHGHHGITLPGQDYPTKSAFAHGVITSSDGSTTDWNWGSSNSPYVLHRVNPGPVYRMTGTGKFYINGKLLTNLHATATGTWDNYILAI
jgi:hypothetical protein